ncbi:unnamed protein product [Nesidiocoris tenuis]|uniref:Uncharacterized protein n=1 Tax=Nesidiocoris tenuis TaxID=355587 RepID=A0A6H5HJI8_9HEMI|nr:unnamed protein product [Nesidiocoris tenuis]
MVPKDSRPTWNIRIRLTRQMFLEGSVSPLTNDCGFSPETQAPAHLPSTSYSLAPLQLKHCARYCRRSLTHVRGTHTQVLVEDPRLFCNHSLDYAANSGHFLMPTWTKLSDQKCLELILATITITNYTITITANTITIATKPTPSPTPTTMVVHHQNQHQKIKLELKQSPSPPPPPPPPPKTTTTTPLLPPPPPPPPPPLLVFKMKNFKTTKFAAVTE